VSLARSSLLFALGTLISRFSGLARDMVTTHLLGAGPLHDAFVVAQRIPNLLRDMLAEGALGSSFTKVYTALKEQDGEAADRLLFHMLYLCLLVMSLLTLIGLWLAPSLVTMMSLGAATDAVYARHAVSLTRILMPTLAMAVIGAVAMGALYQRGKFFLNAVIPVLANLGVIAGGLLGGSLVTRYWPELLTEGKDARVIGLAWGTVVGFVVQMVAALWNVRGPLQAMPRGCLREWPWSPHLKQVLMLMGPAVIAGSAGPINSIVNTNFATSVGSGAVTWLNYAFRILQLPIGVFGVAVGVYALPALTRAVTQAGRKVDSKVSAQLEQAVIFVSWLLVPCMLFTLLHHHRIIDLLFGHGRYTPHDVDATGQALFAYAFSMLAYGLIKVMTSFYYAVDRTNFAMRVSLAAIAINFLGNSLFVKQLGHVGLALTTSLTLSINALVLIWGSTRMGARWNREVLRRHGLALVGAGLIFALASWGQHTIEISLDPWILSQLEDLKLLLARNPEAFWVPLVHQALPRLIDGLHLGLGLILVAGVFMLLGLQAYGKTWRSLRRG